MENKALFSGYVPWNTRDNCPTIPYGDNDRLKTYEEVTDSQSFAGKLAYNVIMFDIDEGAKHPECNGMGDRLKAMAEALELHCLIRRTLHGGVHAYFMQNSDSRFYVKRQCTGVYVACGLRGDFKAGCNNGLSKLKDNGIEREIIYDKTNQDGSYDELPYWLFPIDCKNRGLFNMCDGDGRDSTLFTYILTLQKHGFRKDEVRSLYDLVNVHMFADKLSTKEIERITREDAFPKDIFFDDKNKFKHNELAKMLVRESSIKLRDDKLFTFNGAYYEEGEAIIKRECTRLYDGITKNQKNEVISSIRDRLEPCDLMPSSDYVCFKNGLLNLNTWQLEDFNSNVVLFNQIPHDYNPKAYNTTLESAIAEWCNNDSELQSLILEIMGYGLVATTKAQKAFFFHGARNNGKSTFLEWLKELYGKKNVTNFNLKQMAGRFNSHYLENTLVNICNDIPKSGLTPEEQSTFKQAVTGDSTYGETKGGATTFFNPYATHMFSCNTVPSIKDENGEIARRLIIFPFLTDFTGKENRSLEEELRTESAIEYGIRLAVEGLARLKEADYTFSRSRLAEKAMEREFTHLDTVKEFISKCVRSADSVIGRTKADVYKDYRNFCFEVEKLPVDKDPFASELMARLGLVETWSRNNITKKTLRVYGKKN